MRRVLRYAALTLAVLAVAGGIYAVLAKEDPINMASSSAGLGMMLLERDAGLYVLAVTQDSPADKAGVMPGDYLIRVDETPLRSSAQLDAAILADYSEMQLYLHRDGQEVTILLQTK